MSPWAVGIAPRARCFAAPLCFFLAIYRRRFHADKEYFGLPGHGKQFGSLQMPARNAVECILDRQQMQRRNGVGTISCLIGPIPLCIASWRRWSASGNSSIAQGTLAMTACVAGSSRHVRRMSCTIGCDIDSRARWDGGLLVPDMLASPPTGPHGCLWDDGLDTTRRRLRVPPVAATNAYAQTPSSRTATDRPLRPGYRISRAARPARQP